MGEQQSVANIGNITELNGTGRVVRDETFQASLALDINSYDNVQTSNGRLGITFLDDSQVRLTEHSELIIDEFIYDPDPSKSKMALQFASGTARFITGKLASIDKENISIQTPSATIGIRGTDFTVTVDELGRSLIILLPDDDGLPSGEIVVATAMGQVVLNKPYQATTVSMFETKPTNPVILDLTLELIDNMLIVNTPREVEQNEREDGGSSINTLDADFLEFDDYNDKESVITLTDLPTKNPFQSTTKNVEASMADLFNEDWFKLQGYDTSYAENKVRENFIIYGLARANKPTGRLNVDDIKRASDAISIYGAKAPQDVIAALKEVDRLKNQRRNNTNRD